MWLEYGNLQNMARLEAGLPKRCSSSRWNTTAWGWILSGATGGQKSTGTLTLLPPRIRRTMQGAPPSESRWGMTDLNRKTWTRPAGSRRSTRACRTAAGRKDSHTACAQMPGVQLRPGTPRAWWPPEQGRHHAGQALWETAWHAGPWWTGTRRTTRSLPGRGAGRTSCGFFSKFGSAYACRPDHNLNYLPTHATILCNMPLAMPSYATVSRRFQGSYLHASVGVEA